MKLVMFISVYLMYMYQSSPSGIWDESTNLLILCNLVELVIILSVSYIFFHQKSYQYSGRNGKIKGKMKYKTEVLKKKSGMLNATQLK